MATTPLASFGQMAPLTSTQPGGPNPFVAFGGLGGNQSTQPFVGGGVTQPPPVGSLAKSMGVNATSPYGNVTTQNNTITPAMTKTTTPQTQGEQSVGSGTAGSGAGGTGGAAVNPLQMTQSEMSGGAAGIAAYNARIAAMNGSTNTPPATGNTPNQGLGTGGGQAPPGSQYNGQGQIVPATGNTPQGMSGPYTTATDGAVTLPQLLAQTANISSQPSPQYSQSYQNYQNAIAGLNQSQQQEAGTLAQNYSNPIPLEFQQGRGQVLTNQYLSQQDALAKLASGSASAMGSATSQQTAEQQGLLGAAGLAQPQQVPYSNQYVSPLTGQPVGGGSGGNYSIQSAAQQYAQKVQNGEMSYNDAVSALSGYGVAGQQALNSALPQGFNVNQSNATAGSQGTQTQQAQQWTSFLSQSRAQTTQLNQLITQANINPSDINGINSLFQKIASNTSDPNYNTFQNIVQSLANDYANILTPAGTAVTDYKSQLASQLINATTSGAGLMTVLNNLDATAQAKINTSQTAYGSNTNTTSGSQPSGWF